MSEHETAHPSRTLTRADHQLRPGEADPHPPAANPVVIPGLVLDGLNYSGKTTVLRLLQTKLCSSGFACDYRKCILGQDAATSELHDRAFDLLSAEPADRFPDPAYLGAFNAAMSGLLRLDTERQRSARYARPVLQDRHWLSQYLNNEFFTPGVGQLAPQWVRDRAPRFSCHVYLTCSHASRMRRHRSAGRIAAHRLNRYLIKHIEQFAAFENANLERLARLEFIEVIDTDLRQPEEIAEWLLFRLQTSEGIDALARTHEGG